MKFARFAGPIAALLRRVAAAIVAEETDSELVISNDRLYASVSKSTGRMSSVVLDDQDLLGPVSGSTGVGPYLDCYCTPSGFWTPGTQQPEFELYTGTDGSGTDYAGIRMADTYPSTGQRLEQWWWLRDGETGMHLFSRVAYYNEEVPFLRNLQELRTLFRPNTDLWTHLVTDPSNYAPLPGDAAEDESTVVQDATWYYGDTPEDPYVEQYSDYFTKYTFADTWRDIKTYGLFADGSATDDGTTFGAWMVMSTKDTYFGGPTHSDLTVDGILYNYISSNHHGDQTPNITHGFDRTFGPSYHYFNHMDAGTDLESAYEDAAQFADPEWSADFYDAIAEHVPNYVPTTGRATWNLQVELPSAATNAVAVLAQNSVDFQDNVFDTTAYQYWANIGEDGSATIPMVKAGTYRLTVYAEGVFGQFTQDDVEVAAGETVTTEAAWQEETSGTEIFRIGTPDRSSGEYLHGAYALDSKPLSPEQYRIYWGQYDFPSDFPEGVRYTVGESDPATDLNYIHWSVFGGKAHYTRPEIYVGTGDVNNWTIAFDLGAEQTQDATEATFTVQLAGAKTAAGNTDVYNASEPHSNLAYTVNVNGNDLEPWTIPYDHSSSCGVRSEVICYYVAHKFVFDPALLVEGENEFVLSLPYDATNYESAMLAESVYVQYDALRLEIAT